MKRHQPIELLKLIAVFFVVIIHNRFAPPFGFIMDTLARFAVPVFFMITGYFIVGSPAPLEKLKKQIFKLSEYYIAYVLIYILNYFIIALWTNKLMAFKYSLETNIKSLLISPTMGFHLWYVINIIWVLMIVYIFAHFNKLKVLFILSSILHLIGILLSHLSLYLFHKALPLSATRNFLFFGLFYVMLGIGIKKLDISKIKLNQLSLLTVAVIICLLQVAERFMWEHLFKSSFGDYFFTTIIASSALFIYALRSSINHPFIEKLSSYSMPIYFLHVLVMELLSLLLLKTFRISLRMVKTSITGNFIFILLTCILSCIVYDLFRKIIKPSFEKIWHSIKISA